MFGFSQPEFIEDEDKITVQKEAISLIKYVFFGSIVGFILNV